VIEYLLILAWGLRGEHAAGAESGRDDIPSHLRGARRVGTSPPSDAHVGAGLLNPCSGEAVRLALMKMGRETSAWQAQARALGWNEIKEFIGSAGQGLRADRERALLCVAYETLARRSELVALEV
jgi:integrase